MKNFQDIFRHYEIKSWFSLLLSLTSPKTSIIIFIWFNPFQYEALGLIPAINNRLMNLIL